MRGWQKGKGKGKCLHSGLVFVSLLLFFSFFLILAQKRKKKKVFEISPIVTLDVRSALDSLKGTD